MFSYSWKLTIYALLLISPTIFSNRVFNHFTRKYSKAYQGAKGDLSALAQETIGNIRTVKAFANEEMSLNKYMKLNEEVTRLGYMKVRVWSLFMFFLRALQ
jgi:ABC-type multidrug transport system fused ATPase/permease subunit